MKKGLPIFLLVSLLCFGTASCGGGGGGGDTENSESSQTSQTSQSNVTVEKVELQYDGETRVVAGTNAKLEAVVTSNGTGKVTWTSSNSDVAKVVNGTVSFKKVTTDTEVTITATSKDDTTKSDSITFTVVYTAIDFSASKGDVDTSLYLDEGTIDVQPSDTALMLDSVYGTKWYVEAEIAPSSFDETDLYPKFGIMAGSSEAGNWNSDDKTLFYYVDAQRPDQNNSWTGLGFVGGYKETDGYWDWGNQFTTTSVAGDNKVTKDEPFKMGMLRDGNHYYLYAGVGEGYKLVKHNINTYFAADEATYAWIGGWKSGFTVSNVKALVGDAVDANYTDATEITVSTNEQTLYINDTYQIDYSLNSETYNPGKLSFTSSNPEVATVSSTGLITAGDTDGTATITVAYGELKQEIALTVTSDTNYKVLLNAQMDDALWSQTVKDNKITITAGVETVDVYVARNSKGVYIYGDYKTDTVRDVGSGWFEKDNVEFRLVTKDDPVCLDTDQIWVSSVNGGSHNASEGMVTALTLNEETNKYEMSFEIFVPYNDNRLTANAKDPIGLHWGTAALSGWVCCDWWYNAVYDRTYKVSYYNENVCQEHIYGAYKEEVKQSCTQEGLEVRECYVCSHRDEKVNPIAHNYTEVIEIVSYPTCSTKGSQVLGCVGCDEEITADIEKVNNVHPHGATYNDGAWSCCGSSIRNQDMHESSWGWGGVADWSYIARELRGDFVVTTTYTVDVNDPNSGWARGILPIVQHDLGAEAYAKNEHGSCWVTRMDWWGWCDQWQSSEKLTNQWNEPDMVAMQNVNRDMDWSDANGNNCSDKYVSTVDNCTIEWKCTRTGTTVLNEFTITASDGTVYTYWTKATDVNADKALALALASEYAVGSVISVSISQPSAQ